MRVLHVITGLAAGGAEQQLRLLLRHLPMHCDVITLTNPGAVAEGIREDGTRVTHLGMGGNRDLSALPRLTRAIRSGGYDVVHTHLYRACVFGRIAARLAGVRGVVATEHSLGAGLIENRPLTAGTRALYLATERLGTATIAVSATVAERLRDWGVPDRRIHLVPNGIDARHFRFDPAGRAAARSRLGIPEDAFVIGGVGRLVPTKHYDVLLRAVAALPEARLVLVGEGSERAALEGLTAQLGISGRVRFLGECDGAVGASSDPVSDLPCLLAAMDIFVSPSSEETFGLAILEALAAGLPVLHAACPALEELPEGQTPGARRISPTVEEVTLALTDAQRRHQASGPQRLPVPAVVAHYDIVSSADRLATLYERIATAPRRAGRRAPLASLPPVFGPKTASSEPKAAGPEPKRISSEFKAAVPEPKTAESEPKR